MKALIECVKGTKEKYEIAPDGASFILNRMLKRRWIANYGFMPETLQADGDELDCYVIGKVKQGDIVDVFPICLMYCIDNLQVDNKLVCAAVNAGGNIRMAVRRIAHFVKKYKKGCFMAGVSWNESNIRYEIAKCRAYHKLFRGGK